MSESRLDTDWPEFARAVIDAHKAGSHMNFGDKNAALAEFARLWLESRDALAEVLDLYKGAAIFGEQPGDRARINAISDSLTTSQPHATEEE